MRDTSKNSLDKTNSAKVTFQKDTFRRLAQQADGGVDSSTDGYGTAKRVDPTTGTERLQDYENRFINDLKQMTGQAKMSSWEGYCERKRGDGVEKVTEEIRKDPKYDAEVKKQAKEWQEHLKEKEQKKTKNK